MAFPAFLDTCTLFGAYLCDTMLRVAEAGVFRPLWSEGVMDELERNLISRGVSAGAVRHRIADMQRSFPDADVTGYEQLVDVMTCHPKDRHVLAAAVRGGAGILVTFNVRDFPHAATRPYDVEVVHPDDFLLDQLDLHPAAVRDALLAQIAAYSNPPLELRDLLDRLEASGVRRFAAAVTPQL